MKLAQALVAGVTLTLACIVGERFYQQRVISDALSHLDACLDRREQLFLPQFQAQEEEFRAHCAPGVSKIEVMEAEWKYVAFRVWNTEQKAFSIATYKHGGRWSAQGHPTR